MLHDVKIFFEQLLSPEGFIPRGHCGLWTEFHRILDISANSAIAFFFLAAAATIFYIVNRRSDVPCPAVLQLFAALLTLCGIVHVTDVIMFYYPVYRLDTVFKVSTALMGGWTSGRLLLALPSLLSLQSVNTLRIEISKRLAVEAELRQAKQLAEHKLVFYDNLERELDAVRGLAASKNQAEISKSISTLNTVSEDLCKLLPALRDAINKKPEAP